MTFEELQGKIKPLLKEDIQEDVFGSLQTDLQSVVNDSINGVISSKEKILDEKKKLQAEYEQFKSKYSQYDQMGITQESYSKLQSELEALKASGVTGSDDIKKLQEQFYEQGKKQKELELTPTLKQFEEQLTGYEKQAQAYRDRYINKMKDNAIMSVVNHLGIKADEFWIQGFKTQADIEYNEQEDAVTIQVPNPLDPKSKVPLNDWAKLFPQSEQGKRMIPAPMNGGAGASGSGSGPGGSKSLEGIIGDVFNK